MRDMPEKGAPGTVLAFDFGLERIGVAVGEAGLATAHPLPPIAARLSRARFEEIGRLLAEWRPGRIVVGLPLGEDGAVHEAGRRAERFARQLEGRFRIPVTRVDERYTSAEAESRVRAAAGARRAARASRRRELDSLSAQLILEQFFDDEPA
jgi:putative Holliday junction resolvase